MSYDSRPETYEHIHEVRRKLQQVVELLLDRALVHDQSKLRSPEVEVFDEFTPELAGTTYGSDEYKSYLEEMGPALGHHYRANRHHPEHWENGVHDMTLIDVIEMLADWKAATMRHDDGNLARSIAMNAERYGYGDEFKVLLQNTAAELGWL